MKLAYDAITSLFADRRDEVIQRAGISSMKLACGYLLGDALGHGLLSFEATTATGNRGWLQGGRVNAKLEADRKQMMRDMSKVCAKGGADVETKVQAVANKAST